MIRVSYTPRTPTGLRWGPVTRQTRCLGPDPTFNVSTQYQYQLPLQSYQNIIEREVHFQKVRNIQLHFDLTGNKKARYYPQVVPFFSRSACAHFAMKPVCLVLLASLTVCNLTMNLGQSIPDEESVENRAALNEMLHRADTLLLRSILRKIGEDGSANELVSSQQDWVSKRQHPGKRFQEEIEKRQHPGKRGEDEVEDYSDLQKRQHPGKREDEMDNYVELERRQHPGKRSPLEQLPDSSGSHAAYLVELSKRQHPGKRYLMYSKRQHPGRRELGEEMDSGELPDLEKRQHPGKRYADSTSPDSAPTGPCGVKDPASCSKASLLLELLDNATKSRAEEKRQHPGKRFAFDEDLTEQE
ncbi:hypothetical protein AAFF_G00041150 [Aldrovandia affinis]|uniref:Thyroliberin n=1 Tax=Aldrovandia affinis TaxID=143900 RepID=A0AAD7S2N7_9TELE|nr:hypothetical protein AAFF_G00041150 [Aldrovandia affinis]